MLTGLARPAGTVRRVSSAQSGTFEPTAVARPIQGSKEAVQRVDMSLELMDIEALDTGQYHAMVVQDPTDKRSIKGYFHFIQAYPLSALEERGQINERPLALRNLIEKLSEWTDIKADIAGSVPLSSAEVFKVPFIFFDYGNKDTLARLTPGEARRLGEYMLRGGLYMAEDGWPALGSPMDKAARATIVDALCAVGRPPGIDWSFEKIANAHEIYHCYYDFQNGPPTGGDIRRHPAEGIPGPFPWLEGVLIDGRLFAIMSNKAYQDTWALVPHVEDWMALAPRSFQMGINIIVFSLTQEGSITHRLMESIQ